MPNSHPLTSPTIKPMTFPSSSATRPDRGYRGLGSSIFFFQKSRLTFPKTLRSISTIASRSSTVRGRMFNLAKKSSSIGSLSPLYSVTIQSQRSLPLPQPPDPGPHKSLSPFRRPEPQQASPFSSPLL